MEALPDLGRREDFEKKKFFSAQRMAKMAKKWLNKFS